MVLPPSRPACGKSPRERVGWGILGKMVGFGTPEEAALDGMPSSITHVVQTRYKLGGKMAYVLLAVEANPPGFYLDENLCECEADGSWQATAGAGGGFTSRTLDELCADPPRQGLFDSFDHHGWS